MLPQALGPGAELLSALREARRNDVPPPQVKHEEIGEVTCEPFAKIEDNVNDEKAYEQSYLKYKLKEAKFADWHLRSGLLQGWDVLTPAECKFVFSRLSEDLVGPEVRRRSAACATFVLALTGLTPKNFQMVRLNDLAADCSYDPQRGWFAWRMSVLNPRLAFAPPAPAKLLPG